MKVLGNLTLVLALTAVPAYAQEEECPNPEGWRPSPEELEMRLLAHKEWLDNEGWKHPTVSGTAVLCNANLVYANLEGAILARANLRGANLFEANLENADLSDAQLQRAFLHGANLQHANLSSAHLQDANLHVTNLQEASLSGANLEGAFLFGTLLEGARLHGANLDKVFAYSARFSGAYLTNASFREANIQYAKLDRADLADAQLYGADLRGALLREAALVDTDITGAKLHLTDLTGAIYAPIGSPNNDVQGITGLSTVVAFASLNQEYCGLLNVVCDRGSITGLVQLRQLLQDAGHRRQEREATYAIERSRTHYTLLGWQEHPLAAAEAMFRIVAFEWPVAYGLRPGRALLILVTFIGVFALVYLIPLTRAGGGIYRVWPEGRLEERSSTAELVREAKVERVRPPNLPAVVGRALQFSLLSAFHLGWREINVGNWIARVQAHEYTLRATGWVRVVAGIQSLLSVYLLALWALTYFGRPFQ